MNAVSQHPTPLSVLIVDDNPADRQLTAICLNNAWPFASELLVDTAADGPVALEQLKSKRYALVLLDWRLPAMDGGAVLRAMRQSQLRTPVIVVSGASTDQIGAELAPLGATFLSKEDMTALTLRQAIAESLSLLGYSRR